MQLHRLIDHSYQTFLQQLDTARIILLHPHSRYRSMLIARLINTPDLNVFYYAMGPDDINLQAFISSIGHTLANQHPTFGRHINILPQNVYEKPEDHFDLVLTTFIKDLAEISSERFILVLDEYDRSDASDDIQRFVERLSNFLPDHCRLVVNSRTLPRLPWVSMIAQRRAVLLQDERIIYDGFYNQSENGANKPTPADEKLLEVYALGPGFVLSESLPVDSWEGHLPRLLFFFALDRPVITRSEICQAFWPELEPDQAVNVFHVTKRRLHKALDHDVLIHEDGYYRINPEMSIYYDVMEFTSLLMNARDTGSSIDERMSAWERATNLYRGPFLQGHNDPWITERRVDFCAGYLEALTEMARVWQERGRHEQALALLQKGLVQDPNREDVHREVMQLYNRLGRRSEAAAHYQQLAAELKTLNREPETATSSLYQEIMA